MSYPTIDLLIKEFTQVPDADIFELIFFAESSADKSWRPYASAQRHLRIINKKPEKLEVTFVLPPNLNLTTTKFGLRFSYKKAISGGFEILRSHIVGIPPNSLGSELRFEQKKFVFLFALSQLTPIQPNLRFQFLILDNAKIQQTVKLPLSKQELFRNFRVQLSTGPLCAESDTREVRDKQSVVHAAAGRLALPIVVEQNGSVKEFAPQINFCLRLFDNIDDAPLLFTLNLTNPRALQLLSNSVMPMSFRMIGAVITDKQLQFLDYLYFVTEFIRDKGRLLERYAEQSEGESFGITAKLLANLDPSKLQQFCDELLVNGAVENLFAGTINKKCFRELKTYIQKELKGADFGALAAKYEALAEAYAARSNRDCQVSAQFYLYRTLTISLSPSSAVNDQFRLVTQFTNAFNAAPRIQSTNLLFKQMLRYYNQSELAQNLVFAAVLALKHVSATGMEVISQSQFLTEFRIVDQETDIEAVMQDAAVQQYRTHKLIIDSAEVEYDVVNAEELANSKKMNQLNTCYCYQLENCETIIKELLNQENIFEIIQQQPSFLKFYQDQCYLTGSDEKERAEQGRVLIEQVQKYKLLVSIYDQFSHTCKCYGSMGLPHFFNLLSVSGEVLFDLKMNDDSYLFLLASPCGILQRRTKAEKQLNKADQQLFKGTCIEDVNNSLAELPEIPFCELIQPSIFCQEQSHISLGEVTMLARGQQTTVLEPALGRQLHKTTVIEQPSLDQNVSQLNYKNYQSVSDLKLQLQQINTLISIEQQQVTVLEKQLGLQLPKIQIENRDEIIGNKTIKHINNYFKQKIPIDVQSRSQLIQYMNKAFGYEKSVEVFVRMCEDLTIMQKQLSQSQNGVHNLNSIQPVLKDQEMLIKQLDTEIGRSMNMLQKRNSNFTKAPSQSNPAKHLLQPLGQRQNNFLSSQTQPQSAVQPKSFHAGIDFLDKEINKALRKE